MSAHFHRDGAVLYYNGDWAATFTGPRSTRLTRVNAAYEALIVREYKGFSNKLRLQVST